MSDNEFEQASQRLHLRNPEAKLGEKSIEKGSWEKAAEMSNRDLPPEEQRAKVKAEADMAEDGARKSEAEAKQREAEARQPESNKKTLTSEEQGQLAGGLVQKLLEGGISPERAYELAFQTLNPKPSTAPPAPSGQGGGIEGHIVKTYFDDLRDEVKRLREKSENAPQAAPRADIQPRDPAKEAADIFERYRTLGEGYMKSIGLDPENVGKLKDTPEGTSVLQNIGGGLDAQMRLIEFQDDQKRKWAAWEKEQKRLDAADRRREKADESSRKTKNTLEDGASKLFDAGTRALNAVSSRSRKEEIEDKAGRTGENPKCPDQDCGGVLATGGPDEFPFICQSCGKGWTPDDLGG